MTPVYICTPTKDLRVGVLVGGDDDHPLEDFEVLAIWRPLLLWWRRRVLLRSIVTEELFLTGLAGVAGRLLWPVLEVTS